MLWMLQIREYSFPASNRPACSIVTVLIELHGFRFLTRPYLVHSDPISLSIIYIYTHTYIFIYMYKGKGKVSPVTGHEGTKVDYKCNSTLFFNPRR